MNRVVYRLVAAVATLVVLLSVADSASAQGCCKAGICRIPQIPASSTNNAMLDSMLDNRDAVAARQVSQNPTPAATAGSAITEVSLVNPVNSQAKIEYILDGKAYALEPGMTLTMKAAAARKIEFSRNASAKAAYRVSRGVYEFAMTDKGWELYRTQQ